MANLIIKPTSGGSLVLQDEGGDAALTVAAAGTTTFAENATFSGTGNNLGTVTAGTIGNAVTGVNKKLFGFSAYLSTAKSVAHQTWTEINTVWTEHFDTNGKFGTTSGRFTPTIAGVYHCGYTAAMDAIDDNNRIYVRILRNGSSVVTDQYAKFQNRATATNATVSAAASALVVLDTDDYVSIFAYHDSGGTDTVNASAETQFWGYYVGTV